MLSKQNQGGKKHINPLKRTNSVSMKKDPISDSYSFYMFHIEEVKRAKSELQVDPKYRTKSQKKITLKTRNQ